MTIRYDWPRWGVAQGTSRFTCYAPTKEEAERLAVRAGFPNARAFEIIPEIDPAIAEREAQALQLRAAAPLRAKRDQEGLTGLGLFEPPLI